MEINLINKLTITNEMHNQLLQHSKVFQIIGPSYLMKGKEDLFKDD